MDQLLALRVFVRIAESGGFSKAADALNIPRPTVTKLVQDLERHLGTQLLQRTTRRVSVTPEGAAYYEGARRLIAELVALDEQAAKARAQPRGRIRVDVGSSLANMVLIPALAGFRGRYPEIDLDLGVSDRAVDLIGEGVDCVIRGGVLADTSLVARKLGDMRYVTCATPRYLTARGTPQHPDELAGPEEAQGESNEASEAAIAARSPVPGHALVGYFSSLTGKAVPLLFQRGAESLSVQGRTVLAVNESTAHLSALLSGMGIGQTLDFMAAPHLQSGALKAVLPEWTRLPQPLHLVYPRSRHLNAKVRVFADWAVELFASFNRVG